MKHGFATVLVLIMIAALSTAVLSFWHTISNLSDISIEQGGQAHVAGYAECIIAYGITTVQRHFDLFYCEDYKQALPFDVSDMVIQLGGTAESATLTFNKLKVVTGSASLRIIINSIVEQGGYRCHIRCLLIKQKTDDKYVVDGYTFVTFV